VGEIRYQVTNTTASAAISHRPALAWFARGGGWMRGLSSRTCSGRTASCACGTPAAQRRVEAWCGIRS